MPHSSHVQEDPGEPLVLDSEKPLLVFPLLPLEVF